MIIKSKMGSGIRGTIDYLFDGEKQEQGAEQAKQQQEKQAKVLLCEGLSEPMDAWDLAGRKALVKDFKMQAELNPSLRKNVQHTIISFAKTDPISPEKMVSVSEDYIKRAGLSNTQYIAIRHEDREHQHVHIVANRVDNNGKTISDQFIKMRDIERAQVLARKYDLTPTLSREKSKKGVANEVFHERKDKGKNLSLTNQERLSPDQKVKYEIYESLNKYTSGKERTSDLESLRKKLEKDKIAMMLHEKDGKRIGISFAKGDYKFSGVQVDKGYSLSKLEEKLVREQQQELKKDLSRGRGRSDFRR
jgi:Relaxase/Mobilisation nuclease domain